MQHAVLICFFFLSCHAIPILKDLGQARGLMMGTAIRYNALSDPPYAPLVSEQYDIVTFEGAMKWLATEPAKGVFNFTRADTMMAFAQENNITVRGHNCTRLCWYAELLMFLSGLA